MNDLFQVLHEDEHLLAINKPAGLVCHPTKGDAYSSLISRVRLYLPQAPELHMLNRLDRETSGIVLVAKDLETATEIRKCWERGEVRKRYLAIVYGWMKGGSGFVTTYLGRDEASAVAIRDGIKKDGFGTAARTDYETVKRFERVEGRFTLLQVFPHTGRKHQIRIHLSHLGHPIVGDKIYGLDEQFYLSFVRSELTAEQKAKLILEFHALHAGELKFKWREKEWGFKVDPEPWFSEFCQGANVIPFAEPPPAQAPG
jgi:23S rRNA pseudouridine1911/1915/1917 synthase